MGISIIPQFGSWATEGTYPISGNAWSNQPMCLQPVADYFLPDTPALPEDHNWNLRAIAADHVALFSYSIGAAFANWKPWTFASTLLAASSFDGPAFMYDATYNRWIGHVHTSTTCQWVHTPDGGNTWLTFKVINNQIVIGAATNGGNVVYVNSNDSNIYKLDTTNTLTTTSTGTGSSPTLGAGTYFSAGGQYVFYWVNNNIPPTYNQGEVIATPDGTTLTLHAPPADFTAGSSTINQVLMAQSPTTLAVALCGKFGGTDTPRLMTMDSSIVMTDLVPSGGILTNRVITGFTYDAVNALWLMMLWDNTTSYLYYSASLIGAWTLAKTFTGQTAQGLAEFGGAWVTSIATPMGNIDASATPVFVSTDRGQTWHQTTVSIMGVGHTFGWSLVAGPQSMLAAPNTGAAVTVSHQMGLP